MDRETIDVYEQQAAEWQDRRSPPNTDAARAFGHTVATGPAGPDRPVVDLGCGPGWFTRHLGTPVVALDAARAMLDLVPAHAPAAWRVQADLAHLPFGRRVLGAAWANKSYVHLPRAEVPMALHDLHRALAVDTPFEAVCFGGDAEHATFATDDFPGRRFSLWPTDLWRDVLAGAGFTIGTLTEERHDDGPTRLTAQATRAHTLADTVGPDMRVLMCGLNPSLHAADAGFGFSRPGNRFWPAALAAGLVSIDRDPVHALIHHGVGMTDLVKRASARADGLTTTEYADGLARIRRLAAWLQPQVVCFVGLAGWRAATDRRARPGLQSERLGGRPIYVMPNTSGVNASSTLTDLTEHLRAVVALVALAEPPGPTPR